MIIRKHYLVIPIFLNVIAQDVNALSKPIKIAAALGTAIAATVGGSFVYQKIEKKRFASCLDRIESYQSYAQEHYAEQLTLTKNLDCALTVSMLDKLADSLKDKPVKEFLNSLAAEIDTYKKDIAFIKAKKSEEYAVLQAINKAEQLVSSLINLYDHIERERDYFLKHTFIDRQYITRGREKAEHIRQCYITLATLIDFHKSVEQITEKELHTLSNSLLECMNCQQEFVAQLTDNAQAIAQVLYFINTQSSRWHEESSLYRQAKEHQTDYQELDMQLKFLAEVLEKHSGYFELEQQYKYYARKYPSIDHLSALGSGPELLHGLILDQYPQSSVVYPYVCFADTSAHDCSALQNILERFEPQLSSYHELHEKISNLVMGVSSLTKIVTHNHEFQRQKEAQQQDQQTKASIEAQRILAANQQEQLVLEKEKKLQDDSKLRELQRANELHSEQNTLKKRNQELKAALLRECQPQADLLVQLRDLLRKVHEAPQEKLSESQLDAIIKRLKNVHALFTEAGLSVPA